MLNHIYRLLPATYRLLLKNSHSITAFISFCTFSVGWYLAWPPLGFIIPSTLIFACLAWQHLRHP
jgi:hypothetical protein